MGLLSTLGECAVAPFAGAWIEIAGMLPDLPAAADVAPFAGAWIEIRTAENRMNVDAGRSLRGSVD